MEVYNELGYGFLEKVYENALIEIFKEKNITYSSQAPIKVKFRGKIVGIHEAQLLNYLKATGIKVGLLLNFSPNKLEFKKMVL